MTKRHVDCYRDQKGQYLVFPVAFNEHEVGKLINRPIRLGNDATAEQLGHCVRSQLEFCDYSLFDASAKLPETAAGAKSYSQFAKKHQLVSIRFSDVIRFIPSTRDLRGAYWYLMKKGLELPLDGSDEEVGNTLQLALSICREGPRLPEEA